MQTKTINIAWHKRRNHYVYKDLDADNNSQWGNPVTTTPDEIAKTGLAYYKMLWPNHDVSFRLHETDDSGTVIDIRTLN